MFKIIQLVEQDCIRFEALECVRHLDLPQCYLAAGFVRNLVWDHLHQKTIPTALNDVDVIYYDIEELGDDAHIEYEAQLTLMMPQVNWQVRNQAKMHSRNGDKPYKDIVDAMSFWPEKETAVAIRKTASNQFECISAFGFESLFNFQFTHNPKHSRDVFESRINSKDWLAQWPMLKIVL